MRKSKGILVCLLVTVRIGAVDFQPVSFGSTSAYLHEARGANIAPQSAMRPTGILAYGPSKAYSTGSPAAISASNFETLNSEGGACYNPTRNGSAIRRVGRSDDGGEDDSGAIGAYGYHSPVGTTPWLMMLLLAGAYILLKRRRLPEQK